jgi:hypothetical protein
MDATYLRKWAEAHGVVDLLERARAQASEVR